MDFTLNKLHKNETTLTKNNSIICTLPEELRLWGRECLTKTEVW